MFIINIKNRAEFNIIVKMGVKRAMLIFIVLIFISIVRYILSENVD